jgi:prepilin-type N-terminal cleavage/methylation domain-containing protein
MGHSLASYIPAEGSKVKLNLMMKRPSSRTERGFSLLEIIIVVSMILIALSAAILQTSTLLPSLRANSAMNQVFSQLRDARDIAMTQRRWVQVQFVGNNQITTTIIEPVGVSPSTTITLEGGAQFLLFSGIPDTPMAFGNSSPIYINGVTGGPSTMNYTSTGAFADGNGIPISGTVFLGISGKSSTARAVTILGATGRTRQYHWDGKAWQE